MHDDGRDRFEPKRIAAQDRLARERNLVWSRIAERLEAENQSAAADESRDAPTQRESNDEQG